MLSRIASFILIILLTLNACKKPEDSTLPVNLLHVFNETGAEINTRDGGFIFRSGSAWNVKLDRFDKSGNKLWTSDLSNHLTHYSNYEVNNICEMTDGGFAGITLYQDTISSFTYLNMFKIDAGGRFIWERLVGIFQAPERPVFAILMNDGNDNLITSYFQWTWDLYSGYMKIDSSGVLLDEVFNNSIFVSAMSSSKDYFFAELLDYNTGPWLEKLDTAFNILFQIPLISNYDPRNQYYKVTIFPTPDGGCLLSGYTNSESNTYNFYIQKFSSSGSLEWIKKYGNINNDYLSTAIQTKDGGLLLVGTSSANALNENHHPNLTLNFNCKGFAVKLDASYNLQWEKMIGGDFGSQGIDATEDESGQIYFLGKQVSHGNDAMGQLFILRLSSYGSF